MTTQIVQDPIYAVIAVVMLLSVLVVVLVVLSAKVIKYIKNSMKELDSLDHLSDEHNKVMISEITPYERILSNQKVKRRNRYISSCDRRNCLRIESTLVDRLGAKPPTPSSK